MSAARALRPSNDNLPMAEAYRRHAAEYGLLARATRSLKEGGRYRKMAQACSALAREEDWLAGKGESFSPTAKP